MENELLRVTVLADKGADIFEFVHKPSDTDFMWRTPWGVRDPSLFIPSTGWGEGVWHDMYEGDGRPLRRPAVIRASTWAPRSVSTMSRR